MCLYDYMCTLYTITPRFSRGKATKNGRRPGLTNTRACPIITVKSEPRTRLAPQSVNQICGKATNLPSLMRSGGRFFIVLCLCLLGSFPDDDRHGILSYVEGQTHTHHPLSEGWNQPPACECSLFTVPFRGLLFYLKLPFSSSFSHSVQTSAPHRVSPSTRSIRTLRSCPRRPVPCTFTGM